MRLHPGVGAGVGNGPNGLVGVEGMLLVEAGLWRLSGCLGVGVNRGVCGRVVRGVCGCAVVAGIPGGLAGLNILAMSEWLILMDRSVLLMQIVGGSGAAIFLCYAAYLFFASGGDPQGIARGRQAVFGVLFGLLVLGFATVVPRVFSEVVLEPSGGRGVTYFDSRMDCDGMLKRQLVLQRQVNDDDRVNYLIGVIQARNEFCSSDNWDPVAEDVTSVVRDSRCVAPANPPSMGRLQVPPGLRVLEGSELRLAPTVKRDGSNNIVVHFDELYAPTDGSACWVYFSRYDVWRIGRIG